MMLDKEQYYEVIKKAIKSCTLESKRRKELMDSTMPTFYINKPDPLNQYSIAYFSAVPKRILKNGPAMVVFWKDGTKTVVKRKKGEPDNIYHAFTAALAKKIFGSNSKVNSIVGSVIDETKKSKKTAKNNK